MIYRYQQKGVSTRLQDVLDKLQGKKLATYKPAPYSSADILAAKKVLDRLLTAPERNEIVSIKEVPRELEEE